MVAIERQRNENELARAWLRANRRARRRGDLPVLAIGGDGLPGRLLVVHEFDLAAVAAARTGSVAN